MQPIQATANRAGVAPLSGLKLPGRRPVGAAPTGPGPSLDPMEPGGDLVVSSSLVIPAAELQWRYSTSGGPGGQHANTAHTRAEVTFDIAGSAVLNPATRQRLLARFGPRATVSADDTRSQLRNRQLAAERLAGRLRAALVVERERRATRPGRGAVERRLKAKRHQSERKADRRQGRRPADD